MNYSIITKDKNGTTGSIKVTKEVFEHNSALNSENIELQDRIKELEGQIKEAIDYCEHQGEQYMISWGEITEMLKENFNLLNKGEQECYCAGLELEGLDTCKHCGRTALTPPKEK